MVTCILKLKNWGQFCKTMIIFVHIYQVLEKKNTWLKSSVVNNMN